MVSAPDFSGGGIPLTKNLAKEKAKDYLPNETEWKTKKAVYLRATNNITNGTANIYTVPANRTFFLTYMNLMGIMVGVGVGRCSLHVDGDVLLNGATNDIGGVCNLALPCLMRFEEGETITVHAALNQTAWATIAGWEEDKEIFS